MVQASGNPAPARGEKCRQPAARGLALTPQSGLVDLLFKPFFAFPPEAVLTVSLRRDDALAGRTCAPARSVCARPLCPSGLGRSPRAASPPILRPAATLPPRIHPSSAWPSRLFGFSETIRSNLPHSVRPLLCRTCLRLPSGKPHGGMGGDREKRGELARPVTSPDGSGHAGQSFPFHTHSLTGSS